MFSEIHLFHYFVLLVCAFVMCVAGITCGLKGSTCHVFVVGIDFPLSTTCDPTRATLTLQLRPSPFFRTVWVICCDVVLTLHQYAFPDVANFAL